VFEMRRRRNTVNVIESCWAGQRRDPTWSVVLEGAAHKSSNSTAP